MKIIYQVDKYFLPEQERHVFANCYKECFALELVIQELSVYDPAVKLSESWSDVFQWVMAE